VVAWAPQVATGDEGDDGIRKLVNAHELTRTYSPTETRLGWTFVDSRGRCWEAVSAKVVGRAEPWPKSLLPNLLYDPQYRLDFEFIERPPMPFADIRKRLLAAIESNPRHYRWGYGAERRQELLAAETLEEVAKPDWLKSLESRPPEPLWEQWLMWQGRSSRLEFLAGVAVFLAAWVAVLLIAPVALVVIPMVLVSGAFGLSAIVRRMHALKQSGWWIAAWLLWSFVCGSIHAVLRDTGASFVGGWLWWISNLCIFGCLALWPGTRGPNRYGFAPRKGRRRLAAGGGGSA
jgi:uncharacterized membrane protein YhaH (DUF805 family)